MKTALRSFILFMLFLLPVAIVHAQPTVAYQIVTSGLNNPVDVVPAPGDTRLYIAQQDGLIRIWNGTSLSTFANLGSLLTNPAGGEQGLLSLAFHPDYEVNRYYFVWYTNTTGAVTLARYRRSASNADTTEIGSGQVLLSIAKPGSPYFTNHNGGKLIFGNDGMLYIGTGDGGGGGDPFNNAQNGNSLLGKMLRLDVSSFASSPPFYNIPADNPFLAPGDGILDEIYATGLRNPWRWSFDRGTGDMWIADVGQGEWEEVNWLPAGQTAGVNYGWKCYEGNHLYGSGCSPALTDTVSPVFEYPHNNTTGGFSITGGYVYRGTEFPSLQGYYITTDYISNNLWLVRANAVGGFTATQQPGMLSNISGFGEAADGTLYAIHRSSGTLYKVIVATVVPVRLTRFDALGFDGYNELSWLSATESRTSVYHIEYSVNGADFIRVGEVTASGSSTGSSYVFRHDVRASGNIYYRLAIEDADGAITYSAIVRLIKDDGSGVKVYPSIVSNGNFTVSVFQPADHLRLLNSNGGIVYQKNLQGFTGNLPVTLPALTQGVYILRVSGNGFTSNQKIIIQ